MKYVFPILLLAVIILSGCIEIPPAVDCDVDSDCSDDFICDANGDCTECPVPTCEQLDLGCHYEPDNSQRCPACGELKCSSNLGSVPAGGVLCKSDNDCGSSRDCVGGSCVFEGATQVFSDGVVDVRGVWTGTFEERHAVLNIDFQDGNNVKGSSYVAYREPLNQDLLGTLSGNHLILVDQLDDDFRGVYDGWLIENGTVYEGEFTVESSGAKFPFRYTTSAPKVRFFDPKEDSLHSTGSVVLFKVNAVDFDEIRRLDLYRYGTLVERVDYDLDVQRVDKYGNVILNTHVAHFFEWQAPISPGPQLFELRVTDSKGNIGRSWRRFTLEKAPEETCNDKKQNQGETGVDCGGPCAECGGQGTEPELGDGTTYYVSNSGSDSNSGTNENSPIKTISKVNSLDLKPGDNVLFKRGDTFEDATLIIKKDGTTKDRITFSAYDSGDKPVLGNPNSVLLGIVVVEGDYVTIDNLKIYGDSNEEKHGTIIIKNVKGNIISNNIVLGGKASRKSTGHVGVDVRAGSKNTLITNNEISYFFRGIYGGNPDDLEISYNTIHHMYGYHGASSYGGSGIHFWSNEDVAWDANYKLHIHHNDFYAFEHSAIGTSTISRNLIEYNNIHNPLDERIFFGSIQHGAVGKLFDNTYKPLGSIGTVFRYNYVHDIVLKGEAGRIYDRPSPEDLDDVAYERKTTASVLKEQLTKDYNSQHGTEYRTDKPLFIGGDNDRVTVHGLDPWDLPDAAIGGLGYGNIWIHNNAWYNSDHRVFARGFTRFSTETGLGYCSGDNCEVGEFRQDLPCYFIGNTVIGFTKNIPGDDEWWTTSYGVIRIEVAAQSPNYIQNNILDYANVNKKRAIYTAEDYTYISNNLYTNKEGYYDGPDDGRDDKAVWFRYNPVYEEPRDELFKTDPKFIDVHEMIFASNIGPEGTYIPNFNLQSSSPAKNSGAKVGNDPTGRCIDCFDILGNERDSSPDIGAFEYK